LEARVGIEQVFQLAKQHDLRSVALTDTGNLHGVVEFAQAAQATGIKPIIGAEELAAAGKMSESFERLDKMGAGTEEKPQAMRERTWGKRQNTPVFCYVCLPSFQFRAILIGLKEGQTAICPDTRWFERQGCRLTLFPDNS
jgi:hypothetical protein